MAHKQFVLRINLGNATVQTPRDISVLLDKVVDRIQSLNETSGNIYDENGNSVGMYLIKENDEGDLW